MEKLNEFVEAMNNAMRPWLTALITVNYNAVLLWAVVMGHMTLSEYITNVGPANMLILGFWFGERSALKGVQTGVDTAPIVPSPAPVPTPPPRAEPPTIPIPVFIPPATPDLRDEIIPQTKGK